MRPSRQQDLDDYDLDVAELRRQRTAQRRWQDERDDDIEAPDTYPEPEPDHLYTPNQA